MEQKEIPDLCSDKGTCCGCAACYSICPVGAIAMKQDEKGFWYPNVDENKCIGCQKCIHVCIFKRNKKGEI